MSLLFDYSVPVDQDATPRKEPEIHQFVSKDQFYSVWFAGLVDWNCSFWSNFMAYLSHLNWYPPCHFVDWLIHVYIIFERANNYRTEHEQRVQGDIQILWACLFEPVRSRCNNEL